MFGDLWEYRRDLTGNRALGLELSWPDVCWSCAWAWVRERVFDLITLLLIDLAPDLETVESDVSFELWWMRSCDAERAHAYRPRHSRERRVTPRTFTDRLDGAHWRLNWAAWDTQSWPTLNDSGNAAVLVDLTTCDTSYDWPPPVGSRV